MTITVGAVLALAWALVRESCLVCTRLCGRGDCRQHAFKKTNLVVPRGVHCRVQLWLYYSKHVKKLLHTHATSTQFAICSIATHGKIRHG